MYEEEFGAISVPGYHDINFGGPSDACKYNKAVVCEENNDCNKCGWNPEVDEIRKAWTRDKIIKEIKIARCPYCGQEYRKK